MVALGSGHYDFYLLTSRQRPVGFCDFRVSGSDRLAPYDCAGKCADSGQRRLEQTKPDSGKQLGGYYALIIGNNEYRYVPKLQTAVNDATAVEKVLRETFGFQTQLLVNADRDQILSALIDYRRTLDENANLLIYYAGHGHYDRDEGKAYWIPVDALRDNSLK